MLVEAGYAKVVFSSLEKKKEKKTPCKTLKLFCGFKNFWHDFLNRNCCNKKQNKMLLKIHQILGIFFVI